MSEADSHADLIRRVRAGHPDAAEALWRLYEPYLRRELRLRLRDPRLRRLFDETDVCPSVMASFFVRAAAGEFQLDGPDQLRGLVVRMGRHKLADQARRHRAQRRDCRRVEQLPEEGDVLPGAGPSPSRTVAWRDLLQQFRDRLTPEERQLADLRAQGRSWPEIAAVVGGTADTRRVQLSRAVARVAAEMGLGEAGDA